MAPDNTALAGVGATGCANGNHTCNPITPALMPNPIKANKMMRSRDAACARPARTASKPIALVALIAMTMAAKSASSPITTRMTLGR